MSFGVSQFAVLRINATGFHTWTSCKQITCVSFCLFVFLLISISMFVLWAKTECWDRICCCCSLEDLCAQWLGRLMSRRVHPQEALRETCSDCNNWALLLYRFFWFELCRVGSCSCGLRSSLCVVAHDSNLTAAQCNTACLRYLCRTNMNHFV